MIIFQTITTPTAYAGSAISENRKEDECEDKADYDVHSMILPSMIVILYTQPIARLASADLTLMGRVIRAARDRVGNIVTHVFNAADAGFDRPQLLPRPLFSRSDPQTVLREIRSHENYGG